MRIWLVVAVSALLGSCSCEPEGRPEDVVRRMFEAIEARDCDAVRAELGGPVGADFDELGCEETLHTLGDRQPTRIGTSQADGRDPELYLVPVHFDGATDPTMVHVRSEEGAWKVVML